MWDRSADPPGPHHDWLDAEAGPVVRPYAMTKGRVRSEVANFDLMAFVVAVPAPTRSSDPAKPVARGHEDSGVARRVPRGHDGSGSARPTPGSDPAPSPAGLLLEPEHQLILAVAAEPISVAELAARLDLPLNVVRVLLGDLFTAGLIEAHDPPARRYMADDNILEAVVHGLRAL